LGTVGRGKSGEGGCKSESIENKESDPRAMPFVTQLFFHRTADMITDSRPDKQMKSSGAFFESAEKLAAVPAEAFALFLGDFF
jgi:hypothetical protein